MNNSVPYIVEVSQTKPIPIAPSLFRSRASDRHILNGENEQGKGSRANRRLDQLPRPTHALDSENLAQVIDRLRLSDTWGMPEHLVGPALRASIYLRSENKSDEFEPTTHAWDCLMSRWPVLYEEVVAFFECESLQYAAQLLSPPPQWVGNGVDHSNQGCCNWSRERWKSEHDAALALAAYEARIGLCHYVNPDIQAASSEAKTYIPSSLSGPLWMGMGPSW
jgi:hypothetical protein